LRFRLSLLMFLQYAPSGAMLPQYSLHLQRLGFSDMEVAVCCATQSVASIFAALIAGHVADRWVSAERCLAACALVSGLDLWLLAGLTDPAAVFAATLVFWLVTGPIWMLGAALCFAHLPEPGRQYGPVRLWGTVGWMAAAWLLSYWFDNPGWLCRVVGHLRPDRPCSEMSDLFRLGSLLAFVLCAYALTLPYTPPQPAPGGQPAPLAALALLRGPSFLIYGACLFGVCVTWAFATQGTPLLLARLGVAGAWMPRLLTLAQATEVVALGLLPMLLLRLGVRGTMLMGLAAWTAALAAQACGRPVELVAGSLALNGLCISGVFVAGQVFVNSHVPDGLRASVQGLLTFVNGLGMLLGNLLVGWLRRAASGDLSQTFAVGAFLMTCLLLTFLLGFHDRERVNLSPHA
jgi:MFS family permease